MMGTAEEPGIIPRLVDDLFCRISKHENIHVSFSFMEIYNESVNDLLLADTKKRKVI